MGLSREPYGCVRLHDSACLLISENILQLNSRTTGLFMDTTFVKEKGFKMERMKNPLLVKI